MRDTFVKILFNLSKQDNLIRVVTGDLGFGVLKPFYQDSPDVFINAGIAEQNMTSFAAGLALEGFKPVTYSIGNFPTLRCLEQIRNDICYHDANVKIVCVGGGYTYGVLGMSHHATEDIGVMRTIPNLVILSPCDKNEAISCTNYMMSLNQPCYLRLGRNGSSDFTDEEVATTLPSINKILNGYDIGVFCTGEIVCEAIEAASELKEKHNISLAVFSCPLLKPFPNADFLKIIKKFGFMAIITLEEHNVINGLGTIISNCFDTIKEKPCIYKMGIADKFCSVVGDQKYLRKINKIDCDSIVNLCCSKIIKTK